MDYFESVDFAVTVCDNEGVVLYQNARAKEHDGDAVGRNLFACHGHESGEAIRRMIATGAGYDTETVKNGRRRIFHRTPWHLPDGTQGGLVEVCIETRN